jgi:hypothetical protein
VSGAREIFGWCAQRSLQYGPQNNIEGSRLRPSTRLVLLSSAQAMCVLAGMLEVTSPYELHFLTLGPEPFQGRGMCLLARKWGVQTACAPRVLAPKARFLTADSYNLEIFIAGGTNPCRLADGWFTTSSRLFISLNSSCAEPQLRGRSNQQ